MENSNTKTNTFYYLEVSQDACDILNSACKGMSQLMCGNLEGLRDMAIAAYEKRNGKEMLLMEKKQIDTCIQILEMIGWGRPTETINRFSDESDTMRDISDVLEYQQYILGIKNKSEGQPPHYNKAVSQMRVIDVVESTRKRNKQLKAFVERVTPRRRI